MVPFLHFALFFPLKPQKLVDLLSKPGVPGWPVPLRNGIPAPGSAAAIPQENINSSTFGRAQGASAEHRPQSEEINKYTAVIRDHQQERPGAPGLSSVPQHYRDSLLPTESAAMVAPSSVTLSVEEDAVQIPHFEAVQAPPPSQQTQQQQRSTTQAFASGSTYAVTQIPEVVVESSFSDPPRAAPRPQPRPTSSIAPAATHYSVVSAVSEVEDSNHSGSRLSSMSTQNRLSTDSATLIRGISLPAPPAQQPPTTVYVAQAPASTALLQHHSRIQGRGDDSSTDTPSLRLHDRSLVDTSGSDATISRGRRPSLSVSLSNELSQGALNEKSIFF